LFHFVSGSVKGIEPTKLSPLRGSMNYFCINFLPATKLSPLPSSRNVPYAAERITITSIDMLTKLLSLPSSRNVPYTAYRISITSIGLSTKMSPLPSSLSVQYAAYGISITSMFYLPNCRHFRQSGMFHTRLNYCIHFSFLTSYSLLTFYKVIQYLNHF